MAAVVGISDKIKSLRVEGWHLSSEKVAAEIEEFDKLSSKAALEELKNSDLKNIGVASFPDEISKVSLFAYVYVHLVTLSRGPSVGPSVVSLVRRSVSHAQVV